MSSALPLSPPVLPYLCITKYNPYVETYFQPLRGPRCIPHSRTLADKSCPVLSMPYRMTRAYHPAEYIRSISIDDSDVPTKPQYLPYSPAHQFANPRMDNTRPPRTVPQNLLQRYMTVQQARRQALIALRSMRSISICCCVCPCCC